MLSKNCIVCGIEYIKNKNGVSATQWEKRKFCSQACRFISMKGGKSPMEGKNHSEYSKSKMSEKHKGIDTWNKGKTGIFSEETLQKISKAGKGRKPWNTGKKLSEEIKQKISETLLSKKGGVSSIEAKIRGSWKYQTWRKSILERDNYTCALCGKSKDDGVKLHVDHIKAFSIFPDLRFDSENARTLCIKCHRQSDTYSRKSKSTT